MITSYTAGLFSFLIDGARTMLIAGTRSSGKTSLLGSLLLEIMPKYRIIVTETKSYFIKADNEEMAMDYADNRSHPNSTTLDHFEIKEVADE